MWWRDKTPEKPLGEQLFEARDAIARQIEILESPVGLKGRPDSRSIIADLERELGEINDAIARSKADNA
jgi:hypothetical protein